MQDFNDIIWRKRYDTQWTSYYSNEFHILDGATQNMLRCFKYADGTQKTLDQMNVYPKPLSTNARARQHDCLYEVRLNYAVPADDIGSSGKVPLNVRTHNPATPVLLAVGEVDREAHVMINLAVGGSSAAQQALSQLKSEGLLNLNYLPVALFLADGLHRWLFGASYEVESPEAELRAIKFDQEHLTRVNPEDADVISLHADMALDVRPRLSDNSASWVPASSHGTATGIAADPSTGDLFYLDPKPVAFEAPSTTDTPTHRAILLPDSMYCLVPHSAKCSQNGKGEDFWMEFGGLMRRDRRFERLRVAYAGDGSLASVVREVYA